MRHIIGEYRLSGQVVRAGLSDAFYEKEGSNLELVVKLKNCSDSEMLPITGTCDILKEYCQFIEIVEHMYNERFPKKSFRKAIETAISQGILVDYLDRKSREVINMLCAKYDYKMDIAVKQEEAFEDGVQKRTVEAVTGLADNGVSINIIAKSLKMTEEDVQKILEKRS